MAIPERQILVCQSFRVGGDPKGVCFKQTDGFLQYLEEEILARGLDILITATGCMKFCARSKWWRYSCATTSPCPNAYAPKTAWSLTPGSWSSRARSPRPRCRKAWPRKPPQTRNPPRTCWTNKYPDP